MIRNLTALFACTTLLFATAGAAQDTATETPAAESETTETPPTLDLGQPVSDEPQLGSRYPKEEFDDWTLACIKTEADQDPCSLLQIVNGPGGNPMAEFSLFRLDNGGAAVAGATVIVPLETLLGAQLTIAIDDGPGKRYNYTFCNPVGCVAQIGFTQEDIDAMKKGNEATLSLVPAPAPDQQIDLKMSLRGFTAGYEAVDVVTN